MRTLTLAATSAILLALAKGAVGQTPDAALSSLPQAQQDWVSRSCPRSLGPSLWASCVNREVAALKRGLPDLSRLTETERAWAHRSCPSSLGPSLAISCLSRELTALTAGMPKLDQLPADQRAWVQQSCPQSLGPSLYKACAEREARALTPGVSPPRQQVVPSALPAPSRAPSQYRRARRADVYPIETSHNDEIFVINGEKFEAKTYCFNMEEDDEVMFLEGSPFGACVSATLLNLRTRQKCEVWCE